MYSYMMNKETSYCLWYDTVRDRTHNAHGANALQLRHCCGKS